MRFDIKAQFSILLLLCLTCYTLSAEAFFTDNKLKFHNGNEWIAAQNIAGDEVIKFQGDFVTLQNGTILDSNLKSFEDYIAPLIGAIMAFSLDDPSNIPESWLACDGSEIGIANYPLLYNAIGDTWGDALNPAKFKLPDFTNMVLRGVDNFGFGAANRDDDSIRYEDTDYTVVKNEVVNVGSYQKNKIKDHQHNYTFSQVSGTTNNGSHSHVVPGRFPNTSGGGMDNPEGGEHRAGLGHGGGQNSTSVVGARYTGGVGAHTHSITLPTNTSSFNAISASENVMGQPKRMYLVYCIKYEPI